MIWGTHHRGFSCAHAQQLRADRTTKGADNAFVGKGMGVLTKSSDEVSSMDVFNGAAIDEGSYRKAFIYHDQAIVHSWEQCQVIGAANGINTGHRHLPTIVVGAPSYLPDDGRRFDLAVFLGRLREQFVCMSNNERVDSVAIRKLSNDLAEDDGFACRRGEDQQFFSVPVVFVGRQNALHTLLLIGSEHNGRERWRRSKCQGGTGVIIHGRHFL